MTYRGLNRRAFIMDLGRGSLAVAIFGLTAMACTGDDPAELQAKTGTGSGGGTTNPPAANLTWERVNLGFVSAYILVRAGEAAIVDTGVSDSEDDIAAGLGAVNLGWGDVSTVVITHLHNDHQGSLPAVMGLAPDATGYAGARDIPEINSPRNLIPVGDGDTVFDLDVIETPGHTPGHISLLHKPTEVLLAGDAMNGAAGKIVGANPQFTADMDVAARSIKKLARFRFDTIVFGHGDPVIGGASDQVAVLASQL